MKQGKHPSGLAQAPICEQVFRDWLGSALWLSLHDYRRIYFLQLVSPLLFNFSLFWKHVFMHSDNGIYLLWYWGSAAIADATIRRAPDEAAVAAFACIPRSPDSWLTTQTLQLLPDPDSFLGTSFLHSYNETRSINFSRPSRSITWQPKRLWLAMVSVNRDLCIALAWLTFTNRHSIQDFNILTLAEKRKLRSSFQW